MISKKELSFLLGTKVIDILEGVDDTYLLYKISSNAGYTISTIEIEKLKKQKAKE